MRKTLIIFFLLLIISVPIGQLLSIGPGFKLTEKRKLAEFPQISIDRALARDLYTELDKYFNDHFVLRGAIIKAKSWIDYRIFNTSPSSRVYIGKDGWLYGYVSLKTYIKSGCEHRKQIRNLAKGLQKLEKALASNGQKFIFVVTPNKTTIYPEYVNLDQRSPTGCDKSDYDLLLEAFEEFPIKGFVRLDSLFMKAKSKGLQLYDKTESHWNLTGGRIAMEAIRRHISPDNWKR